MGTWCGGIQDSISIAQLATVHLEWARLGVLLIGYCQPGEIYWPSQKAGVWQDHLAVGSPPQGILVTKQGEFGEMQCNFNIFMLLSNISTPMLNLTGDMILRGLSPVRKLAIRHTFHYDSSTNLFCNAHFKLLRLKLIHSCIQSTDIDLINAVFCNLLKSMQHQQLYHISIAITTQPFISFRN